MIGSIIKIYSDPLTEMEFEGLAEVINVVRKDDLFYYLNVRFNGEEIIVGRKKIIEPY